MVVEEFTVQQGDDGIEYNTFAEGLRKTEQGGLCCRETLWPRAQTQLKNDVIN